MERCDDNSDTAAANLLGTVVEYYGVSSHSIEWRTDSKPGSKSSIPVSPFDLSDGLRRNNALWKEVRTERSHNDHDSLRTPS